MMTIYPEVANSGTRPERVRVQPGCCKAIYWIGDRFLLAKTDDLIENKICSPIHPMNFRPINWNSSFTYWQKFKIQEVKGV